nr:ribonuclease H-like domain-containing protein [Tanacetum cinerariifolium]
MRLEDFAKWDKGTSTWVCWGRGVGTVWTFNRLQVTVSQLKFIGIEIEHDDPNQKFLTSLAPEWLMHTIVWRNMSDLNTISLDDLYNHLKVYESEVQKKSELNFQNMAFISSAKNSSEKEEVNTASVPTSSTNVSPASVNIGTIDEDDIEEMDIKWNMALLSIRADRFWKKIGKNISIQGTDVAGFDKSKVECFNCHKMGHFTPKALMAIDGVGWDWSFMANEQEDHALVADEEAPTKFALMAKTSAEIRICYSIIKQVCHSSSSASQKGESTGSILSKPEIKFVRPADSPTIVKSDKTETIRKSSVKYAKLYRKPTKMSNVRGNQRNWNNLKSQQLSNNFVMKKACYNCGGIDHLSYDCGKRVDHRSSYGKNNNTHKSKTPRTVFHKTGRPPMRTNRPYMNVVQPKRTYSYKPAHSYIKRPFQRTSTVRSQFRGSRVATVNRNFPTVNRKISTVNRKFPTGNTKFSTADLGSEGTAGNSQNHIDDKRYWDSGCSRHMTGNISDLFDYEPFDGGYVSFGQGDCKITGKGTIKTSKLEFENVYFVKDLKYNLFSMSQICDNKNSVLYTDSECIVLGRDFKLIDDTNVLLRMPRQHKMYSIDLNNIAP